MPSLGQSVIKLSDAVCRCMGESTCCRNTKAAGCCCLPQLLSLPARVAFIMLLDTFVISLKLMYWLHYNFFFIQVESLLNLVLVLDVSRAVTAGLCITGISKFYFGSSSSDVAVDPRQLIWCYWIQYIAMQSWDYVWVIVQLSSPSFCLVTLETPLLELIMRHFFHPARSATSTAWHQFALSTSACSQLRICLWLLLVVSGCYGIYFDILMWQLATKSEYVRRLPDVLQRPHSRSGFVRPPDSSLELTYIPPNRPVSSTLPSNKLYFEGFRTGLGRSDSTVDETPKSVA
eukprot:GHVS01064619.1.p1 GENE.GHVS01064619.1~~GHVS01064619.1.p1  ORF type:complete len:289 (+),score=12.18 GHVS01064619.1:135-1001(+)